MSPSRPSPTRSRHYQLHLAESFIMAGAHDRGLDLLERSVSGFYPYPYMAEFCSFLEPVRGTPRFARVLGTAKAQMETFAAREAELAILSLQSTQQTP